MRLQGFVMMAALLLLPGCFLSERALVRKGVLLSDGPAVFCTPGDTECPTGVVTGDGYSVSSENDQEEDIVLRFEALTEAGGETIWLGEAELRDEDSSAWMYVLARRAGETPEGIARIAMQLPACSDMPDEDSARFKLPRADAYSCAVTDLASFREYLIARYGASFADPEWWTQTN